MERLRAIVCSTSNRIVVEYDGPHLPMPDLSDVYVYVPWGSHRFLVPENRMIEFCFWANDRSNWTEDASPFPMRQFLGRWHVESDVDRPSPLVPHEYEPYLLKAPVGGIVLSSSSFPDGEPDATGQVSMRTTITARCGNNDGFVPRLSLFLVGVDGFGKGTITRVDGPTCRACFVHRNPGAGREPDLKGVRVSTDSRDLSVERR